MLFRCQQNILTSLMLRWEDNFYCAEKNVNAQKMIAVKI